MTSFFNPPEIDNEILTSFGAVIAANAERMGDKPALVCGDVTLSWRAFGDQVARVSGALQARGVQRGDMVASLAENSAAHVVLFAAVVSAGACMVPLPFSATADALRAMIADSGAQILFASDTQAGLAAQIGARTVLGLDMVDDWGSNAAPAAPADVRPQDLFNMIYSSGTTGMPKGIIHDHRFRSRQLGRITRFGLTEDARMLISTPVYSNTTLFGLLPMLTLGATLVIMPKFNVTGFLTLSQDWRVTHTVLVPVQYMRLMNAPEFGQFDLSSYRCKFSTSAPLPGALIAKVMERWPGNLIEVYGMTEGGVSTALNCGEFPDKWDTVGRAGEGSDLRVIDDQGNELPTGEMGEIVGRSTSMMTGYHNLPDKTAELLWRDEQGRDFIRSGDMGRIDADGFLQLLDRKKDMIISGGFNIYAADLEAVLRAHSDVADVAVIAIPSPDWGETPLGFVVLNKGAHISADDLRIWANDQLGKTQRLSAIELRDDLPRSDIGKVLKRDLRAPYWPDQAGA
ncbi:MAG: class I adenylate-forming enzyme family protein [Paracoccaceae bacterium]